MDQLANASSQDLSMNLVTVLPARSSVASQQLISDLEPRIRMGNCFYREGFEEPASSYIIKSQATGSRTIVNYNALPEMEVAELIHVLDGLAPDTAWFHFEVWSMLEKSASNYDNSEQNWGIIFTDMIFLLQGQDTESTSCMHRASSQTFPFCSY